MGHPLHVAVAKEIKKRLADRYELIKDSACGGTQHISLFVEKEKGFDTRICDVDLLIVVEDKIKVIVEIEESGFFPTKICGKFLQSAIARYFIHDSRPKPVPYDNRVLFIQVLDGSKCLPEGNQKNKQAEMIKQKICDLIPLKGSTITDYDLFFVLGENDCEGLNTVGRTVSEALN